MEYPAAAAVPGAQCFTRTSLIIRSGSFILAVTKEWKSGGTSKSSKKTWTLMSSIHFDHSFVSNVPSIFIIIINVTSLEAFDVSCHSWFKHWLIKWNIQQRQQYQLHNVSRELPSSSHLEVSYWLSPRNGNPEVFANLQENVDLNVLDPFHSFVSNVPSIDHHNQCDVTGSVWCVLPLRSYLRKQSKKINQV